MTHDLVCLILHLSCLSVICVEIRDFLTSNSTPGNLAKYGLAAPASAFRIPSQLIIISLIQNKHVQLKPTTSIIPLVYQTFIESTNQATTKLILGG